MRYAWFVALSFATLWAQTAQAQMVRAQDPSTLAQALQQAGYAARIGIDRVGDPRITSSVSGTSFEILFYNCTANKDCATVQFHSGYDLQTSPSLQQINDWNSKKRFGRAFLDKENDPILEMDLDLDDGGISPELFIDNVEFWASVLGEFESHIGYRR